MRLNPILTMCASYFVALDILVHLELNVLQNILKNILGLIEYTFFNLINFIAIYYDDEAFCYL